MGKECEVTEITEGSGKKGSEARNEKGPPVEEKEPEPMKMGTGKGGLVAAEPQAAPSEEQEEASVQGMPEADERQEGQDTEGQEAAPVQAEVSPEARVEQLVKENEALQDKFVRLVADFDNYRKRASREKSDVIQFGNEGLLRDILPVIDNIERLLGYSYGEGNWRSFQEGIELLLTEITKTLANYGVEPIEALGRAFDPNLHQAMQRCETEEADANTVLEVYQKGYLYRGRLLRPSLVVVAVPPKGAEEGEGEEGVAPGTDEPSGEGGGAGAEGKDEKTPIN